MKQTNVVRIVALLVLGLGLPSCVADGADGGVETGSAAQSLSSADPTAEGAAAATELARPTGTPAVSPIACPVAALRVDWRINWPIAGLYKDECHGGIDEDMTSGTGIEYEGQTSTCSGESRYYVTNLSTGHRGWVRAAALRSP